MPTLKAELPDCLYWLTEKVESMVLPAAFLKRDSSRPCPRGGTRAWGWPDVPAGARWSVSPSWLDSPSDGEAFWLQLNLADIPPAVRRPAWPQAGVVWLFIDLSDHWTTRVEFDPRPAESIVWLERLGREVPAAASWSLADSLPCGSEGTLPEIWPTWRDAGGGLVGAYDDWAAEHYWTNPPSDIQVGGWMWPIQGDDDARDREIVCAMERQCFGDNGAVYLSFNAERGFYASVETH